MLREHTYGEWAVLPLYVTRFDVGSNRRFVATLCHVDCMHCFDYLVMPMAAFFFEKKFRYITSMRAYVGHASKVYTEGCYFVYLAPPWLFCQRHLLEFMVC